MRRRIVACGALVASLCGGLALPAGGMAQSSNLQLTVAARVCPSYTDISANRARNNIQESLKDLGVDTAYPNGDPISPAKEDAFQKNCSPLPDWTFTLGKSYKSRAVSGPWGSLSIVTSAFTQAPIVTQPSVPLLDVTGQPTGDQIRGAVTITLTKEQADLAAKTSQLWIQGGTPTDPILNGTYPGQYGFGALRCAIET